jgi:hypothetical protein
MHHLCAAMRDFQSACASGLLLSSKPHHRRAIIEEAAGVTRFKTKKRLAELRLESAKQYLCHVATSNQSGICFDPGLADWLDPPATAEVRHNASARLGMG